MVSTKYRFSNVKDKNYNAKTYGAKNILSAIDARLIHQRYHIEK
jgi:hypothetical protein